MLVFNEGVPRAGKSYDAVKNHILPTLKKGRRVFARLNGLHHERIAEYLNMPVDEVHQLLTLVETKDVATTFVCSRHPETGQWCIPDEFKDALVVIDEVHEFYVAQRNQLPEEVENFFALIGQNGGDVLIMTQWINRVHQAVRARIERKNVFQKLTAVGLKSRYRVTYYHTTSPGKFEVVGGKTLKYDPAIYPLYHGYAVGAENAEVYEEGGTNIWKQLAPKIAIAAAGLIFGIWAFGGYFIRMMHSDEPEAPVEAPAGTKAAQGQGAHKPISTGAVPAAAVAVPAADPLAGMTVEQRYVAAMTQANRIRLAFTAQFGDRSVGMVEWVDGSGNTVDQLTFDALIAMGYRLRVAVYGVRLTAGSFETVATAWPREAPRREEEPTLYRLDSDRAAAGSASVASGSGGGAGAVMAASSGGAIVRVGERPMGTFPESKPYPPSF